MTTKTTHRDTRTNHDRNASNGHSTTTADKLIGRYANDIAFVAEETPATTLEAFAAHVGTASSRMEDAGINNAEDLDTASTYLDAAANASGTEQTVLLTRASDLLNDARDMVDEYRLMV